MPWSCALVAPDPASQRRPKIARAGRWLRSRTLRPALGIAACLLTATFISYLRAWRAGTIKVDQAPLPGHEELWFASGLVACLAIAGWLHVRTCWSIRGGRLGALLRAALAIQLAAVFALPLTSNDIFSNLANGRLVLAGHNPYVEPPLALGADHPTVSRVADAWRDAPTPYGPVITALATVAALAPADWAALAVFKLLMLACVLGTVLVAYVCCRTYLPQRQAAAALVLVGWNPLLAWEIGGQAHNDGVMLLATTVFVWAALAQRPWTAVLSIAVAFYAKLAVAPVLGLYLVYQARENWRRAAVMLLGIVLLGSLLWAPFWHGPETLNRHLAALNTRADHLCGSLLLFVCGALAIFALAGGCWFSNCGWLHHDSSAQCWLARPYSGRTRSRECSTSRLSSSWSINAWPWVASCLGMPRGSFRWGWQRRRSLCGESWPSTVRWFPFSTCHTTA